MSDVHKHITIEYIVSEETLYKFLLYYPTMQDIADEIMKQIEEANALMTGKTVSIKYRKYKGTGGPNQMTDGKIMHKRAICHGYKMMELSNGDVMVIDPHGKPIARTTSFREATRIIKADVRMLNRIDGTEDPFQ